jgi:hypothetical protein
MELEWMKKKRLYQSLGYRTPAAVHAMPVPRI